VELCTCGCKFWKSDFEDDKWFTYAEAFICFGIFPNAGVADFHVRLTTHVCLNSEYKG
jgi:hypothetical protein